MKIFFAPTLEQAWGGSELLWSQTALALAKRAHQVAVSIDFRQSEPAIIREIEAAGGEIFRRDQPVAFPPPAALPTRALRWLNRRLRTRASPRNANQKEVSLQAFSPDLVIINQGTCVEGLDWMELCREKGIPYATIAQAAHSYLFCNDDFSERLEPLIRRASSSFFVSNANREMLESFLCGPLANAELVRNPFGVARVNEIPWPDQGILRFAVVARLDIVAKGQDILLEVLAAPKWKARPVELNLYGTGYNEKGLKRRAKCLEIPVHFCGHVSEISTVWQNNHLLLLPSRSEGLPIALVEAMHCNRPAVVTDVGDSASLIDEGVTGFVAAAPTARLFDEALEKAWAKREHWQEMGKRAGECIRSSFPADPAGVFADRLEILLGAGTGNS